MFFHRYFADDYYVDTSENSSLINGKSRLSDWTKTTGGKPMSRAKLYTHQLEKVRFMKSQSDN